MAKISPYPRFRAFDANGNPLSEGKLYTFEAGTSTPKTTYTDVNEGTANPNPIILDADGYADIYLIEGAYKFVLKDASDAEIWSKDDLTGDVSSTFGSAVFSTASNLSVTEVYRNYMIEGTANITLALLDLSAAGEGFSFIVKANGGDVIIDPSLSETIDGASTITITDGSSATIVSGTSGWYSAFQNTVQDGSITNAKLADMATNTIKGRDTAGTGAPEDLTPAQVLAMMTLPTSDETTQGVIEILTDAEFLTGTDSARAIVASNFVKSLGTNGYFKLPGGLILQWGSYGGAAASGSVTFPTSYATACYVCLAAPKVSNRAVAITSISTTQFNFSSVICSAGTASSEAFYWISLGK